MVFEVRLHPDEKTEKQSKMKSVPLDFELDRCGDDATVICWRIRAAESQESY